MMQFWGKVQGKEQIQKGKINEISSTEHPFCPIITHFNSLFRSTKVKYQGKNPQTQRKHKILLTTLSPHIQIYKIDILQVKYNTRQEKKNLINYIITVQLDLGIARISSETVTVMLLSISVLHGKYHNQKWMKRTIINMKHS